MGVFFVVESYLRLVSLLQVLQLDFMGYHCQFQLFSYHFVLMLEVFRLLIRLMIVLALEEGKMLVEFFRGERLSLYLRA